MFIWTLNKINLLNLLEMKKMLAIIVPFLAGTSVILLFGYPLTQALVTGICAMIGMYIGQYFSKRREARRGI
jgi:uncharacterized membrane protein YfcA